MPSPKRAESSSEAAEPTFDQRLARLETIVAELEHGQLGLEGSIERYREGVALLAQCRTVLDGYRKQVEELSASAPAAPKPYAGDPDLA